MKYFILALFFTGALALSVDNSKLGPIVPIQETKEWQEAYPELARVYLEKKEKGENDLKNGRRGRIFNGREALPGELPYQCGIMVMASPTGHCGCSIISRNFVLTASQCVPPGDHLVQVYFGSHIRNEMEHHVFSAEIIRHVSDATNSNTDLALIRLSESIAEFNSRVAPIRLPNRRQAGLFFENQQGRVSGFGTDGSANEREPVDVLRVGFAQIISQTACWLRFPFFSSDLTLCVDGVQGSPCPGDMGTPLTLTAADGKTTQVGVASFLSGVVTCNQGSPAGFIRLGPFLDWIEQNSDVTIAPDFD